MPAASPIFTVLIPTRDRAGALRAALAALGGQSLPSELFEVLVVDDGSRDATPQLLAAEAASGGVRWLRLDGRGPAAARNAGAREARGIFLAFTDDDCEVPPGWLAGILGHFAFDATGPPASVPPPPADAVGGPAQNVLASVLADAYQRTCGYFYEAHNREPGRARFLTTNNFACTRAAFETVGGFDERFHLGGSDRELAERLCAAGFRVRYDAALRVRHAHAFTLASYLRHLYRQGRGSHLYHRRLAPGKGLRPPRTGWRDLGGLARAATRGAGPVGGAQRLALLGLGQAAVLCGFLRAALDSRSGSRP